MKREPLLRRQGWLADTVNMLAFRRLFRVPAEGVNQALVDDGGATVLFVDFSPGRNLAGAKRRLEAHLEPAAAGDGDSDYSVETDDALADASGISSVHVTIGKRFVVLVNLVDASNPPAVTRVLAGGRELAQREARGRGSLVFEDSAVARPTNSPVIEIEFG